ncbi:hypothetical protein Bca52824_095925 [Brassica carinata]|uniref:Uncharacterized protein n=1 Tax=Brassica carinata TaxID=52824 RepID=A0A8X7P1M2_BRACI|nr:hypothetical protein Bca52824_095925 [Brassica carinata]
MADLKDLEEDRRVEIFRSVMEVHEDATNDKAPHPSRWTSGLVPSQPGNPSAAGVTVSASGTNYIASSPSPAGSGGTSVFRETPLQTPCN